MISKLITCLSIILLSTLVKSNSNQIFYEKLSLKPQSSVDTVKKQCKKLMAKYKPENNPGDGDAHSKYVEIREICQDLTHPDKKQIYDQQGDEGLKNYKSQKNSGQQNQMHGLGGLSSLFGGGQQQQTTTKSMSAEIPVTLQDLYNGTRKDFTYSKNVICDHCKGTGDKDGKLKTCNKCKGRGSVIETIRQGMIQYQTQNVCNKCGGKGHAGGNNCPICKGKKVKKETFQKSVEVKPGMKHKQEIIFRGEADEQPGLKSGDLIFTLVQKPHGYFKRVEDNLYMKFDLKLKEAILGFEKKIRHLDDHYTNVKFQKNEIVQPFQIQIIKNEGMPKERNPKQFGDLALQYKVQLPQKLSDDQKQLLKKIFDLGRQK